MDFITIWSLERLWRVLLSESLTCKNLRATLSSEQPLRSQIIHPRDTHLLLTHDRSFLGGKRAPWIFHWNISRCFIGFGFSLPHVVSHGNSKCIQKLQSHLICSSLTHSTALYKDIWLTLNVLHGEVVTSWLFCSLTLMLLGKYILDIG